MRASRDRAEIPVVGALAECPLRELFLALSAAAAPYVPHDEAALTILDGEADPGRATAESIELVTDGGDGAAQFRAWMRVPVRVGPDIVGSAAWLSHGPAAYTTDDLRLLQAVADHVGLARRDARATAEAAQESDRIAGIEASDEILRELAGALDVRGLFPRVSAIVQRVLPHDRMTMSFHEDGGVKMQAASDADGPFFQVKVGSDLLARPFVLLSDLSMEHLEAVRHSGPETREFLAGSGFGSFLAVNVRARDQRLGIEFWSRRRGAFTGKDIPIAKRIADHVALAVSHEQLAEAARQVSEARSRARKLEAQVGVLTAQLAARKDVVRPVGISLPWKAVLHAAVQVAPTEATVLLTGESGTGKEVIARLIHASSARRHGVFVAVNCAALPEALLESELFGYERGAFTGADHTKPGQIDLAEGGILFLDEVSEMSLGAQAKFLRVLQDHDFQRLGGTRPRKADIRVIAATNVDLRKAIEGGRFRRDLYHRLRVFDVALPALRDRPSDILPLAEYFLAEMGARHGSPPGLTPRVRSLLLAHHWPGNVRELRNALERAVILSGGGPLEPDHFSLDADDDPRPATTNLVALERATIERALRETRGNKSEAARRLGVSRMQLYVRLRRHHLA